jgi:hypothetical protein
VKYNYDDYFFLIPLPEAVFIILLTFFSLRIKIFRIFWKDGAPVTLVQDLMCVIWEVFGDKVKTLSYFSFI